MNFRKLYRDAWKKCGIYAYVGIHVLLFFSNSFTLYTVDGDFASCFQPPQLCWRRDSLKTEKGREKKYMRRPGIEPGSTAWKATMLTFTPPTLLYICSKFNIYNF